MTSQALVRSTLLFMAIDAKAHGVIYGTLRDRHLRQVAMTHRAIDSCADMRSVIESHVRLFVKSINTLPWQLFAALRVIAQHLNAPIICVADVLVACHAEVDARDAGARPALHADMTLLTFNAYIID